MNTCSSFSLCSLCRCLQRTAASLYNYFKDEVTEALATEAAEALDTTDMSEAVAKVALEAFTKKKVGDLWDHVALNDNTQCASVEWDSEWEAPSWVTKIWDRW